MSFFWVHRDVAGRSGRDVLFTTSVAGPIHWPSSIISKEMSLLISVGFLGTQSRVAAFRHLKTISWPNVPSDREAWGVTWRMPPVWVREAIIGECRPNHPPLLILLPGIVLSRISGCWSLPSRCQISPEWVDFTTKFAVFEGEASQ